VAADLPADAGMTLPAAAVPGALAGRLSRGPVEEVKAA